MIVKCTNCNQKNNLQITDENKKYKCGKCKIYLTDKRIEYAKALQKIEKNPKDRIGILGEVGIVGIGVVGGVAGAGTAAAAAGATTILGSAGLGSLLGGVFVAATPIGWVLGTAALGGATAFGISRLFRSGNISDERIKQNINELKKEITNLGKEANKTSDMDEKYSKLASMYMKLIHADLVDQDTAENILKGIQSGDINIDLAFKNAQEILKNSY
ncbi:conserved hypothetical protein, membrane [hydrothermal vent metagenome]|uniref:Uncharacterized protein n=1 Tax=hydrothermal vent metagenome TaxID=652676 RepID=A0A1W1BTX9_9ZZZZ